MNVFLESTKGFISFIGAGGKKSTMYALSKFVTGRVALSSTTQMFDYKRAYVDRVVDLNNDDYDPLSSTNRVIAFKKKSNKSGRVAGLTDAELSKIWFSKKFDFMFCKADGARSKLIKGPNQKEPVIPSACDLVIPILSIKALGERLTPEIAHRVAELCKLWKASPACIITKEKIVKLMVSKDGFLRNLERVKIIPLINMVDSKKELADGVDIAKMALNETRSFDKVVLGSMSEGKVKKIVYR